MCVCISVYHCTSDYFWSRHFSFSQFKCSSVNHGAFTKQGRAAATWQSCKEKLLKVNCSTEEAVNTAVQRLSHQPPPSHSKVPRAPHLEVSAQSLSLQNKCLAHWHFSSWDSHMAWRWRGNFLPSLPSPSSLAVLDSWTEVVLPEGRQLLSCYNIKPISHLWLHWLLWISRNAVQCHHVTSLFIAFVDLLLGQYTAALFWDICCLCLGRGLWFFSPSPANVVTWHKPPGITFLILAADIQKRSCLALPCQGEVRPPMSQVAELVCGIEAGASREPDAAWHPLNWLSHIFNTEPDT